MHLPGRNLVLTPSTHCRSPNQPRCRSRYHEINYSSHTGRPNSRTQDSDTKECVALESKSTQQDLPEITQQLTTRLPEPAASDPVIA